jgi:hypothetical protein
VIDTGSPCFGLPSAVYQSFVTTSEATMAVVLPSMGSTVTYGIFSGASAAPCVADTGPEGVFTLGAPFLRGRAVTFTRDAIWIAPVDEGAAETAPEAAAVAVAAAVESDGVALTAVAGSAGAGAKIDAVSAVAAVAAATTVPAARHRRPARPVDPSNPTTPSASMYSKPDDQPRSQFSGSPDAGFSEPTNAAFSGTAISGSGISGSGISGSGISGSSISGSPRSAVMISSQATSSGPAMAPNKCPSGPGQLYEIVFLDIGVPAIAVLIGTRPQQRTLLALDTLMSSTHVLAASPGMSPMAFLLLTAAVMGVIALVLSVVARRHRRRAVGVFAALAGTGCVARLCACFYLID